MHNLSSSFVLGYHGCDKAVAERLLRNQPFAPSTNDYDWLGTGVYYWEANPDRAFQWAEEQLERGRIKRPYVVGAGIDLGFCLDLTTSNGSAAVKASSEELLETLSSAGIIPPENQGGKDRLKRHLDCAVINYLHKSREKAGEAPFDTIRALFPEGRELFANSGFKDKTHIQIAVRTQENIHGVFRVHERYFSS